MLHSLTNTCYCPSLILAILLWVRWYLSVVLIWIFLKIVTLSTLFYSYQQSARLLWCTAVFNFLIFYDCTHGIWKFSGQGLDLSPS